MNTNYVTIILPTRAGSTITKVIKPLVVVNVGSSFRLEKN